MGYYDAAITPHKKMKMIQKRQAELEAARTIAEATRTAYLQLMELHQDEDVVSDILSEIWDEIDYSEF
jgi:hypothetical protein